MCSTGWNVSSGYCVSCLVTFFGVIEMGTWYIRTPFNEYSLYGIISRIEHKKKAVYQIIMYLKTVQTLNLWCCALSTENSSYPLLARIITILSDALFVSCPTSRLQTHPWLQHLFRFKFLCSCDSISLKCPTVQLRSTGCCSCNRCPEASICLHVFLIIHAALSFSHSDC